MADYNAVIYASNAKYFDPLVPHSMPVDTVNTLGAELLSNNDFSTTSTWVLGAGVTISAGQVHFDGTQAQDGNMCYQNIGAITKPSMSYSIEITAISGGGVVEVSSFSNINLFVLQASTVGTFTADALNSTSDFFHIRVDNGTTASITIASAKEITLPTASYIQYLAYPSLTWKQLSSTVDYGYGLIPESTTWTLTESSQVAINSTAPLSDADILALNANQDLIFNVLFDSYVLPSGFAAANIVGFLDMTSGNTGDYLVYDITDQTFLTYKTIENGSPDVNTTYLNGTTGVTNLKLIKDASGRTTGTAAAGTTQWAADGRSAVTGWTITAPFTVTEIVDGVTYTWTSDGNKYINSVASGTYILPTGVWTLSDNLLFDGVTTGTVRGNAQMINSVVIP